MIPTVRQLVVLGIWSFTAVNAYKIDAGCSTEGIFDDVKAALELAFEMAEAGVNALASGAVMTSEDRLGADGNPNPFFVEADPSRPDPLPDLIRNIFAHDDIINDRIPPVKKPNNYNYRMTLQNLKLRKVHETLFRILNNMRDPVDNPKPDDVTIYCDGKRFEVVTEGSPTWLKDKDREGIKAGTGKSDVLKRCNDGNRLSLSGNALGVTWQTPEGIPEGKTEPKKFSAAVQLCKITVEAVKDGTFESIHHGFRLARLFGKSKKKLSESSYGFRPIDVMNQLSLTLLHELTHARGGNELKDVHIPPRFFPMGKFSQALRWDRIKKLTKTGPYVDKQSKRASDWNADSVAYFALGCWLMSRSDEPYRIEDEGTVTRLPAQIIFPE